MTIQISTLRPGLLVGLSTRVSGNVSYRTTDIEAEYITEDGQKKARWETEKTVQDAREHEDAVKVRSKCRALITSVCRDSSFGLLCPEDDAEKLRSRVAEAQALAADFNTQASITRINVYVLVGRVAQDDVSAVQAINSEVRELMNRMERGLKNLDAEAVRDAAKRLKQIGGMLSPAAQERAQKAVEAARSAAKAIVKAGEEAAIEIDTTTLKVIAESRTAFLDVGMPEAEVVEPEHVGRGIDLEPEPKAAEDTAEVAPAEKTENEKTEDDDFVWPIPKTPAFNIELE